MTANSTSWKKGQSGNPGGRTRAVLPDGTPFPEKCRTHAPEAIEAIIRVLKSETTSASDVLRAAFGLLDRGFGRPVQSLELSGPDGGPVETSNAGVDLSNLTVEELQQLEAIRGKLVSATPAA